MLQDVLREINNFFIKAPNPGTYTIEDGAISPLPLLKEGQRIWIVGSDLNDGVFTYHASGIKDDDDKNAAGLQDETFAGTICALKVPPALIALSGEIKQWVETNHEALSSPMQSESFNGYSYAMKTGGTGGNGVLTWRDVFKAQLEPYRRPFL